VLRETLTVKIRRSGDESDGGWLVKYVQVGMKVKKKRKIPFTTPAPCSFSVEVVYDRS